MEMGAGGERTGPNNNKWSAGSIDGRRVIHHSSFENPFVCVFGVEVREWFLKSKEV